MKTSSQRTFFLFEKIHPSWILLSFCGGIVVSCIIVNIFPIKFFTSFLWLIVAILLLFFAIFYPRKASILLALVSAFLVISFRVAPSFIAEDEYIKMIGQEITLTGKVTKDPTQSENGNISLDLTEIEIMNKTGPPLESHIFVQISNAEVKRSDYVTVTGKLAEGFGNYGASIFRADLKNIAHPEPGDIFLMLRDNFAEKIKEYIPMPEAGLGIGYLLGQKNGVEQEIQDALRMVGLTHIIVASGAHLSALIGFARKIFGKLSRFASTLAALLLMLIFLGITGLSASMLRAGLVTSLSLMLNYYGREIHPARVIVLVAALTLIFNPLYLTDLSWLLSFGSFTGIMIITPMLAKFFYGKSKKPGLLSSTLISSVSATIMCTPILLYFFGQISVISVLANLLILPTISFVMGLTFLTGFFAYFMPFLANICGRLALILLDYQISVANFFADNKAFLIAVDAENPIFFLLYLPVIIVMVYAMIRKLRSRKTFYQDYACKD